jgi:subtilisin family serine protease
VAAPGKDIYSTTRAGTYANYWGTSMAAPHVSGLAGLIFSKGSMTNTQVRNLIESRAQDLGTAGKDDVFGHGRIDAQLALSRIHEETDPAITYSGSWTRSYLSGAFGNYVKSSSTGYAKAKFSFTGNGVTWWASTGPKYGVAYVYVDGSYAGWVDLYGSPGRTRYPAFTKSWATSGKHTVEIEVEGTYGRPRVAVDAFSITQPT